MRIVHIEDQFFPESGYQLNFLAKYNSRHGHEVSIICSDTTGSWGETGFIKKEEFNTIDSDYYNSTGVKIIRLKSKGYVSGRAIISINNIIEKINDIKPDIILVHGNDTLTGINILKNLSRIKYPILFDSHMLEIASKNKLKKLFRFYYRKIITPIIIKHNIIVVGVDEACRNYCYKHYGLPDNNLRVIPLGTDTENFFQMNENEKKKLREKYGVCEEDFVFIYTGKISEDKKVHLLGEVFKDILKTKDKRAVLVIVGRGEGVYYEDLKNKLNTSSNKILLFGKQPVYKLNEFYNLADVAIWPGASSLSMFDAQVCGLPVIAENFDVNKKRLSYNNGHVYEMNNKEELRGVIESMFNMPKKDYQKMKENAILHVKKNHSYENVTLNFEKLMYEVVETYKNK